MFYVVPLTWIRFSPAVLIWDEQIWFLPWESSLWCLVVSLEGPCIKGSSLVGGTLGDGVWGDVPLKGVGYLSSFLFLLFAFWAGTPDLCHLTWYTCHLIHKTMDNPILTWPEAQSNGFALFWPRTISSVSRNKLFFIISCWSHILL